MNAYSLLILQSSMWLWDSKLKVKVIVSKISACVGGDKLYRELSQPLLERYGVSAKRTDKAMNFWQVATDQMVPPKDPKLAAERAAEVWRARLGIYDDRQPR